MDSSEIVPGSLEDRDITRFTEDPFPTLEEALTAVIGETFEIELTATAVQVGILASGEVTYKVYVKEQEDTISGVVSL